MIINSILDNDLYKFTMQQAVCQLYPNAYCRYEFINRGKTKFPPGFNHKLENEVRYFNELKLDRYERHFLNDIYFLYPPYVDFLAGYKYDASEVEIEQKDGDLKLIVEGPWYKSILWEVPLLALISELYFKEIKDIGPFAGYESIAKQKAERLRDMGARFADFGTRRRYSYEVQNHVIGALESGGGIFFNGTSNVLFAMHHEVKPIGTQAHEWIMYHAAQNGFRLANQISMEKWVEVYQGDLGIALADTYTSDVFFKSFNTKYAKLYDGVRQDSGDPIEFADKAIKHYEKLRIDPTTKTIVFSDGLDVNKVEEIEKHCRGKIRTSYGIGTNLTNDVGVQPLNIVIKLTACKSTSSNSWTNTCKLSDVPTKYTGDPEMIKICKQIFEIQ